MGTDERGEIRELGYMGCDVAPKKSEELSSTSIVYEMPDVSGMLCMKWLIMGFAMY